MRMTRYHTTTVVILSRRNLKALLAKLDGHPTDSHCEIYKDFASGRLYVRADEDGPHYSHTESHTPGLMHPETEEAIK